jgi:predicted nucleic acid-binding protein
MVLADTSLWIEWFRVGCKELQDLLLRDEVVSHWIVIGELSTGNLPKRQSTLTDLMAIHRIHSATELETFTLIENHHLYGKGIGWNDAQLLASALIHHVPLWTRDKRLREIARKLQCSWD